MEILLIALFNAILYYRTINFSIVIDDVRHYKFIKKHGGTGKFKDVKNIKDFLATLRMKFYGGGLFGFRTYKDKSGKEKIDYRYDHAFTLALHTIISILVYAAFGMNYISFWAALMYSCNPMNTQTSIWLNGRRYGICVMLVLLMIISKPFGFLLYFITPLFQLTAFFAPILYVDVSPLFLLAIPFVLFLARKEIAGKYEERMKSVLNDDHRKFTPKRLIVIIKSLGFNFFHIIFPGQVKMTYPILYWWGRTGEGNKDAYSFNWEFFKGMLALGLLIYGAFITDHIYMWVFMGLAILQWCCILVFVQYNTDRYMSVANPFMMFFISYLSYKYLGEFGFVIPICLCIYYVTNLIPSMRQYETMQDFFDYHLFHDPKLPNTRCEEIKGLLHYDNFHSRIKAMHLVKEGLLRYRVDDYNTLRFAAEVSRLWGNLDEAITVSEMALKKPYIGWEDKAIQHHEELLKKINSDIEMLKRRNQSDSRQVRRAKERKSKNGKE